MTAIADPSSALEVRRVVAASGSSFLAGMRILPADRRAAIYAVYAFCRLVDDIADGTGVATGDGLCDGPGTPAARAAALGAWEAELARVRAGSPATAVGAELLAASRRFALPLEELDRIVEGMRMDAAGMVAPDAATLDRYVRCVAGSVGILAMHVFGAWRGAASERFALALARGIQLTNILRDVAEDAAIGRLYVPASVLAATGIPAVPATAAQHPALPEARRLLGRDARASFRDAADEIRAHARRALLPALVMMGPYERLLRRMEADWTRQPPPRPGWLKALDGARGALIAFR